MPARSDKKGVMNRKAITITTTKKATRFGGQRRGAC
jgi:hypothetical protein